MKLVIATPLYPPDIAEPAPYVKELARRLTPQHEVIVVTYGKLPEKVSGVRIYSVSKGWPTPVRLVLYTLILAWASLSAAYIYLQNGPSSELPAGLVGRLLRKRLVLAYSDILAHTAAGGNNQLKRIEKFTERASEATITDFPLPRPEILSFSKTEVTLSAYEESWKTHMTLLNKTFHHD